MQKLEHQNGKVVGWYCSIHNLYNDILTVDCKYCNEIRNESLAVFASHTKWTRTGWMTEAKELKMAETERELHAEFFLRWQDDERILCDSMNDEQLTAHRNELARIALESKVRTTTADEVIRQRRAKKGSSERTWLLPTDVDSAVKEVKQRQERMTKLDKINETLLNIMSEEDARALMNNNVKKVTEARLGAFKIVKAQPSSTPTIEKNDEPFDFTKLGKD